MIFKILTLFPESLDSYLNASIIKRALDENFIQVQRINIRDYSTNKHKKVDDAPYGGGPGMVMAVEPLYNAIKDNISSSSTLLFFDAGGTILNQHKVESLAMMEEIVMVCGHYEGMDQRIYQLFAHEKISIGDYILTGGELPALVLVDAISRYIPGVIQNDGALQEESFTSGLLEYDQYTRPQEFMELGVPEILLSGHHKRIEEFRLKQRLEKTKANRPDLYTLYKKRTN